MSKTQINMDSPVFAGRLKTHVPEARVFNGGRAMSRRPVAMDILPRPHATARLPADKMAYKKTEPQRDNYVTRGSSSQQAPVQKYQTENYAKPATAEKQSKLKNGNLKSRALMVASVTLLIFGGWVSFSGLRTNQQAEAQVKHLTTANSSNSDSAPDEKQPDPATFGSFKVSPSLPKYIKISKIGVNARVLRMSVNSKNQLMAPGNIYDAGWYENSAKPGDAGGAMLIDGHVHGPTKPGVFMNLKKLQAGDDGSPQSQSKMEQLASAVRQKSQKQIVIMAIDDENTQKIIDFYNLGNGEQVLLVSDDDQLQQVWSGDEISADPSQIIYLAERSG
jgi:sortase (surface protein transpeptidase)